MQNELTLRAKMAATVAVEAETAETFAPELTAASKTTAVAPATQTALKANPLTRLFALLPVMLVAAALLVCTLPASAAFADSTPADSDPAPATVEIKVSATTNYKALWSGDEFDYELSDENDDTVSTAHADAKNPLVTLAKLTFTKPGRYLYKASQLPIDNPAWIIDDDIDIIFDVAYSESADALVATIDDWDAAHGYMSRIWQADGAYVVSFNSSYKTAAAAQLNVYVETGEVPASAAGKTFEFQLIDDGTVLATFSARAGEICPVDYVLEYSKRSLGEHVYTIRQIGTDGDGWTLDKRDVTVTVTVSMADGRNVKVDSIVYSCTDATSNAALFTNGYTADGGSSDGDGSADDDGSADGKSDKDNADNDKSNKDEDEREGAAQKQGPKALPQTGDMQFGIVASLLVVGTVALVVAKRRVS